MDFRLTFPAVIIWLVVSLELVGPGMWAFSSTLLLAGVAVRWSKVRAFLLVGGVSILVATATTSAHGALSAADPMAESVAHSRYVTVMGTVRTYPKIVTQSAREREAAEPGAAASTSYTAQIDVHRMVVGGAESTALPSYARLRATWSEETDSVTARKTDQVVDSSALTENSKAHAESPIARGETVVLSGKVSETFSGDNTAGKLQVQKIHATTPAKFWHRVTNCIHDAMMREISGRGSSAPLMPGVVMGDNSRLDPELVENMRTMGLSHLTAVSGAHVSIVLAAAMALIGGRRPKLAGAGSLVLLVGLVTLVGPQPSVLRAGTMAAFICISVMSKRPASAIPLLSITVMVFSLVDPGLARSLGFQLSVVATGAIVVFGYQLRKQLSRGMPYAVAEIISLPLIAGLATMPLLVGVQQTASVWTVLANALVAPAVAPLMLTGLAGVLILPLSSDLAAPLLTLCEICTWWIEKVTRTLISWPGSGISLSAAFLTNFSVLLVLIIGSQLRTTIAAVTLLASCVLLATVSGYPQSSNGIPNNWQAVQCDVGQGSALLVRGLSGVILIDVGPQDGDIQSCLRQAEVAELKLVILSHYDSDHVRGLDQVLYTAQVSQIWVSPNQEPTANYQWVHQLANEHHIPVAEATFGNEIPGAEIIGPQNIRGGRENANADSLVVKAQTASGLRILALADAPAERQSQLQIKQPVDAVVVGHHGAADQSDKLAAQLKPTVTLFSVGDNSYGHPTPTALRTWQAPVQRRTDHCGHISLTDTAVVSRCE